MKQAPDPIWGDPPPKVARTIHARFIEKLRPRPGEWAEYPGPHSPSVASTIRKHYSDLVDVEARKADGPNQYRIWLRYRDTEQTDVEQAARRKLRPVGGNS